MYTITCSENIIFDPEHVNDYPVSEAKLSERLNEGGALIFTLVKGHPQYDQLKPMESYITVMDDDELVFYGRVINCGLPSFSCQIQYTCEGALSFLKDSEIPPNSSQTATMTAEAFFRHCIAKHNEDVANDPRRIFTVGQVTVNDRNKTETFTINSYTQTKNAIQNNLLNAYGGYLRVRVENGTRYIDWVQHYSDTVNPQEIVIGINIIERTFERGWEDDIYTYLRPVGKNNLVLDNPLIRVFSQEMVDRYGRIVKSVSFSDISSKQALQNKAEEYIANLQTELICQGTIELVDMKYIDGTSPKAKLGDRFNNLEGLGGKELTVTEIERDLTVPYRAQLTFGNDTKLSNNTRSKALSQKSGRNRASAGQNFKHIIEVGDQVTINADTLVQHGNTLNTHYELIQQTQNSYERIAANVETLSGDVQTIQGTGVIQNDELLSHFAGTMNIVRDPSTGHVKGLQFVDGTMVCDTVNGHTVTVGSTIANHTVAINDIDIQVQTIEGSALWTERDHITGVCGEYDVVIDDVTGTKTLVIKSGGGIKIKRNNTEFGLYDQGNLTGGIMVEKINDNSTVTKINGDKVNITATQLAQFGIVDPQTGTLTAGIVAGLINNQDPTQGTVTKIQGDRIIVGDIGTVSGDTVDDWMQNAYSGTGVFAKFLTVKRLTAQEITTLLANIADADIESVYAENIVAQQVSAEGTVSGNNFNVGSHLYYGQEDEFMVLDITKSGDTLTIYKTDGSSINFSKATSLSGAWSGRNFTVTASPQGNVKVGTVYNGFIPDYSENVEYYTVGSSHYVRRKHYIYSEDENGDADTVILHDYVSISADQAYNAGYDDGSASGGTTTLLTSWTGSKLTVTANPQGVSIDRTLQAGATTWNGTTASVPISAVYGSSGQYSDGVVFTPTVDVSSKLQSATFTSNGTKTPDTGYFGFSSVIIDVPDTTPTLSHTWNSGKITVTATPAPQATIERTLIGGTPTWSNNVATVPINAIWGSSGQYSESTGASVTVDASSVYTAGSNAGYASAHVTSSWSNNALTYSKTTSGSANSGTIYVGSAVGQLQGYTGYFAYVSYWTTGNAVAIPSTRKQLTLVNNGKNAVKLQVAGADSGLSFSHNQYTSGWTAAYGKVSVPTSSNTGGSISIGVPPATVDGTTATYTYSVSADNSYAYIKYGNTTVARVSNGAYSNGYSAGYGAARISGSWSNNVYTGVISTSGGTSTSITVTATASISYNSSTHKYTATGGAVAGGSTRQTATATSGTEAYEAGRASGMAEAHNSVYWGINTSSEVYRPNTTLSGYEVWFNILTVTENGGYVLRSQYNADTSISNFSTTAPAGATYDGITNGSNGYYLSGSGSSATAIIVTKSTWNQGSLSRTEYDSLAAAPTALYRKGYSDGQSSGASYTRYTFYKTRTQDSTGYHYTFSIGTSWATPFGSGDGNYYLYKKN